MALPLTRNTTYAALSQVLSSDLNDLQDKIILLYGLIKRVPFSTPIHAASGQRAGAGAAGNLQNSGWQFGSANERLWFAIPVQEGERILSIRALVQINSGSNSARLTAYKSVKVIGASPPTDTQLGANQNSVGSGGFVELLSITGLSEDVPAGNLTHYVAGVECLTWNSGGTYCYGLVVEKSIP